MLLFKLTLKNFMSQFKFPNALDFCIRIKQLFLSVFFNFECKRQRWKILINWVKQCGVFNIKMEYHFSNTVANFCEIEVISISNETNLIIYLIYFIT